MKWLMKMEDRLINTKQMNAIVNGFRTVPRAVAHGTRTYEVVATLA